MHWCAHVILQDLCQQEIIVGFQAESYKVFLKLLTKLWAHNLILKIELGMPKAARKIPGLHISSLIDQ